MISPEQRPPAHSDRLYKAVRASAIAYHFRPGQRINEVALARRLGASRTPLREALNRLVAEGFLTFERDRGFFCRDLSPRQIFELYQFREVLETAAVRLACENALDSELRELLNFVSLFDARANERGVDEWITLDETFHERLTALSRNEEMVSTLENINARIRFVRWLDMESRYGRTRDHYQAIVEAVLKRDPNRAAMLMATNIERRMDEIAAVVNRGHSLLNEEIEE